MYINYLENTIVDNNRERDIKRSSEFFMITFADDIIIFANNPQELRKS